MLHVHSLVEECEITALLARIDMKTREKVKAKFVKSGAVCIARVAVEKPICVELFDQVPQLGRFTLRDEEDGAAGGEQGGEKGKREGRKERWSLGRAATDALAAGMLVTILLDAWRLCFGGIVPVSELPARRLRLPWML